MIGMPADLALARESLIALAFGTETARPSTFCETAASISCACFCGSLFDGLQTSLTPSALAAASAPFLTTDQNEPSSECALLRRQHRRAADGDRDRRGRLVRRGARGPARAAGHARARARVQA